MLEDLPDLVGPAQLLAVQPHPLAHEEGEVVHMLPGLDLKPLDQLVYAQVQLPVQLVKEGVQIPLGLDGDPGEVDGGKTEVAPLVALLAGGVVDVGNDAGAAAHVGDLRLRTPGVVVLQIEGGVDEGEIGEQPLGAAPAGQLEKVVIGLAGVVVDALLHPEDLDGEDRGFPVAQALLGGQHQVPHDHPALGGGVHAVVDGGEGRLGPGPAVHGVQVVNERLHGLEGGSVSLLLRIVDGHGLGLLHPLLIAVLFHQAGQLRRHVFLAVFQMGIEPRLLLELFPQGLQIALRVVHVIVPEQQGLCQVPGVVPAEGLFYAVGHAVIKVDDGLSTVLVVLVGLDGDAGQGGVGGDIVGLPQIAVACGEPALEQLLNVDLAAGGGEGVEVQVVDVNIPLLVGLGVLGLEDEHLVELLGALAAVLEHGAHGGVAVDVGVLPLHVGVHRVGEGDVLVGLHQAGVHLPHPAALVAVEDVRLGGLDVAVVHEHLFHQVLDVLHLRRGGAFHLQDGQHLVGQRFGHILLARFIGGLEGFGNGARDLLLIEADQASVPLF